MPVAGDLTTTLNVEMAFFWLKFILELHSNACCRGFDDNMRRRDGFLLARIYLGAP